MARKAARLDHLPEGLKQQVAQSVVGMHGPSLVPPPYTPKPVPVETEEVVYSIDDVIGEEDDKKTLRALIGHQLRINTQKKVMERDLESLNARIKKLLEPYGVEKFNCDGARVTYTTTTRRTINEMKLAAFGVASEIITASTDVTTSKMLVIREAK